MNKKGQIALTIFVIIGVIAIIFIWTYFQMDEMCQERYDKNSKVSFKEKTESGYLRCCKPVYNAEHIEMSQECKTIKLNI